MAAAEMCQRPPLVGYAGVPGDGRGREYRDRRGYRSTDGRPVSPSGDLPPAPGRTVIEGTSEDDTTARRHDSGSVPLRFALRFRAAPLGDGYICCPVFRGTFWLE
jgi:hypothetical protein